MSTIPPTVRPAAPVRPSKPVGAKPKPGGSKPVGAKPKPRPVPQPVPFAARPIFQASQQVSGTITNPKHPLEVPGGMIVMPVAIAVDLADLVTRPLQALFTLGR